MNPHLLRVEQDPETFLPLLTAVRALGLRAGWLEFRAPGAPAPLPPSLASAAAAGVLRAVAAGGGMSATIKPLRGEPELDDLLREHFRGCALVLVRGEVEAALLQPHGEAWRVAAPGPAIREFSTAELAAALRKPRPFA